MTGGKEELVGKALRAAMAARKKGNLPLNEPICPFDLATGTYGIDVRFEPRASLEGMYSKQPKAIVIGSQRPAGRQTYTCAHELGHHVFGHGKQGLKVDEVQSEQASQTDETDETDEFLAQVFAGFLLMPNMAVSLAFKRFGITPKTASAGQMYALACYFGVGYTAFLDHLALSLRLITFERAGDLKKVRLAKIRAEFGSPDPSKPLIVAQKFSPHRSIDAEIGEIISLASHRR